MSTRFVMPLASAFGQHVRPDDGAKLFFFATGTAVLLDTFSDEAETIPNTNPVIADGNGVFPTIFLGRGSVYKVVLKDKNDVEIFEQDPIDNVIVTDNIFYAENYPDFPTAVQAAAGKTLVVSTDIPVTADIGLSGLNLVFISGGILTISPTIVVLFDTPEIIEAPERQKIFSISTADQIKFDSSGEVWAGWWGFSVDQTDRSLNSTAFVNAAQAIGLAEGTLQISGGIFLCDPILLDIRKPFAYMNIIGIGAQSTGDTGKVKTGTFLDFTTLTAGQAGITITNTTGTNDAFTVGWQIEGMFLLGPLPGNIPTTEPANTAIGIFTDDCIRGEWKNLHIRRFHTGFGMDSTFASWMNGCSSARGWIGIQLGSTTTLPPLSGRACSGMTLDTNNFNDNAFGIVVSGGAGILLEHNGTESCGTGYYINPDKNQNINDITINNPYFEATQFPIKIGQDDLYPTSGTIKNTRIIGGFWDTTPDFVSISLDVAEQTQIDIDQQIFKLSKITGAPTYSFPNTGQPFSRVNVSFNISNRSGTATSTVGFKLVDNTKTFISSSVVNVGDRVENLTVPGTAFVTAIDSETTLSIDADIMSTGNTYYVDQKLNFTEFYAFADDSLAKNPLNVILPRILDVPTNQVFTVYRIDARPEPVRIVANAETAVNTIEGQPFLDMIGKSSFITLFPDRTLDGWRVFGGSSNLFNLQDGPLFLSNKRENVTAGGSGVIDLITRIAYITTTAAVILTLADGVEGQLKDIILIATAGDAGVVPANFRNGTSMLFSSVGDSAQLLFSNGAWNFMGGTAVIS